jgi:hypothetical protein
VLCIKLGKNKSRKQNICFIIFLKRKKESMNEGKGRKRVGCGGREGWPEEILIICQFQM